MSSQCTEQFQWVVYRDATLAGLSALLPVPYLDDTIEARFREQMVRSIAAAREIDLSDAVVARVNTRKTGMRTRIKGLFLKPFLLPLRWITKTWSKMLYVLTVRRAVNTLAHYWRRAYLLDYMVCMGYLDSLDEAEIAVPAMHAVLRADENDTLRTMALDAIRTIPDLPGAVKNGLQALRQGDTAPLGRRVKEYMDSHWDLFADYFDELTLRYEEERNEIQAREVRSDDRRGSLQRSAMNPQGVS